MNMSLKLVNENTGSVAHQNGNTCLSVLAIASSAGLKCEL